MYERLQLENYNGINSDLKSKQNGGRIGKSKLANSDIFFFTHTGNNVFDHRNGLIQLFV